MTNEEHQQWRDALEREYQRLRADKEASKKLLMELGIWHLGVPIKSTKKYRRRSKSKFTKPSPPSARMK